MAERSIGSAVRWMLRSLACQSGEDDFCLLDRFVDSGSEEAFEKLLARHGPMVWRTCQRVVHQRADAEDAFQATFLVLCRRASSIGKRQSLAGWLYQVAFRIALKANARRAFESLQAEHEPSVEADSAAGLHRAELSRLLDAALSRLPAKYREPLILCYLQGKTRARAAAELGWAEGTLSSRLAQAKEALRAQLLRRGFSLPAGALALALNETGAAQALPAKLLQTALKARSWYVLGKSVELGGLASQAVVLANGALKTMFLSKMKIVAAVVVATLAISGGAGLLLSQQAKTVPVTDGPGVAKATEPARKESLPGKTPSGSTAVPKQAESRTLRVVVLDPQRKPVAEAKVHASIWTKEKSFKATRTYQTDAAGAANVVLPKTFYILRLWAGKSPYVNLFANWEDNELARMPVFLAEYTFHLERAVSAGGRIVDEQGKPIPGAEVQVMLAKDVNPTNGDGRVRYVKWLAENRDAAKTDAEGRWRIDNVPNHPHAELSLLVSHPDYVADDRWGEAQKTAGITMDMLRHGTATLMLKRGVVVHGRVTDPSGKPIKDTVVVHGDDPYSTRLPSKFPADPDGRYRLPVVPPGHTTLTAIAPGWAPQYRSVNVQPGLPPQDFHMQPGKLIKLRIVDAANKPISSAYVSVIEWKGHKSLGPTDPNHPKVPDRIPNRANKNGVWEWTWAPEDPVKVQIYSKSFATSEVEIGGAVASRTVVLKTNHEIRGRVTDTLTGKPITAFTVVPVHVLRKDWLSAWRSGAVPGKDGRLTFQPDNHSDYAMRLRVEAMGYRTLDGPEFRVGDDAARKQDFRLQPSRPINGVVLDSAGHPVANAEVVLATPTEQAELASEMTNHLSFTDAAGRFAFPYSGELWTVVARSNAGFAIADFPVQQRDAGALRLQPWASIRGVFRDGGKPVSNARLHLQLVRLDGLDQPRIDTGMMQIVTGPDGRFEFPRVPPVPVAIWVSIGPWRDESFRSGPRVPLDLKPGQRVELDLGGVGAIVTGKVKLTGKVPPDLDCTYSLNNLVRRAPGIAPLASIAKLGFDARNGWRETWEKTAEGRTYLSTLEHWFVKLAPDGKFRISGVPPGDYDLAIKVYAKPNGCLVDPLARAVVRVTVTAADAARGQLALPEIAAAVRPVPAIGDAPAFAFQRADNATGAIADHRGRYTAVHFWASWCGPCKQQLPALRQLQQRYAGRGLDMLGLSLDDDAAAWHAALKRLELPWQQGRLAVAGDAGISSVPTYWLLDPAGKIVCKVFDPDELAAPLSDRLK